MRPDSSVFIFPYDRRLRDDEKKALIRQTEDFLSEWNSHGNSLRAKVWLEESRFLIIEELASEASGCSKDKLFRKIQALNLGMQLQLAPEGRFFVESGPEILELSRKDFANALLNNQISAESLLFPVWITTGAGMAEFWKKPLKKFPALLPKNHLV